MATTHLSDSTTFLTYISAIDSKDFGFCFTDALSKQHFLVDSSAFQSAYPATSNDRNRSINNRDSVKIAAANGNVINTCGSRKIPIQLSGRCFTWSFLIADVHMPLLGANFLVHHGFLIDLANRKLLDVDTYQTAPLSQINLV